MFVSELTMQRNRSRYWSRPMSAIAEYMLPSSSYHVPMHSNRTSTHHTINQSINQL